MIDTSLFPKLVEQEAISLFDVPLWKAKEGMCPFSGHKLYQMMNKPLKYCKSKKCGYRLQTGRTFITKAPIPLQQ